MELSLNKLSEEMSEATREHAVMHSIVNMNRVKFNESSSTVDVETSDGKKKKFAVILFGIMDVVDNIFFWGDCVEEFSEYTRGLCTEVREKMDREMILEATHYALNVSESAVAEARELDQDGGRYIIDENDALLSRFSVPELMAMIFANTQFQGVYSMQLEGEVYHFGIVSAVS